MMVLVGKTPMEMRPFFFGASLVALEKKSGGIRPIALVVHAKVAGSLVREEITTLLCPRQLRYGIRDGAEAAVHTARQYLLNLQHNQAILKLDFKNAFNTIRRDVMLECVHDDHIHILTSDLAPTISPFFQLKFIALQ